ncbi:MAG TPA: bifunctional alpha,alpha-trehalose-phosphate synthase (UDP-forming)/trehalose-phosphatase [Candidatus Saccharimonadia bacterium]|nr:bifunctional alpha,alpha-trehalose-phosphate synthase (UDP-forming)/trehalose-phosphatase [Candidatus Saccharimonadia bacterium]
MPQVIIVSNRLPVSVAKENGKLRFYPSTGGLATGLSSYVNNRKSTWIGWPGVASDELTADDRQAIVTELAKHNCTPVFLSKKQIDDFYNGYSNQVLWPLFHNLRRGEVSTATRKRFWQAYRAVNQKFAEATLNLSERGSHIWVHDYQLMLVPEMIRDARPDVILGFFLHIPWPTAKSLSRLPEYKKLVGGILGADVAGFHTQGYVANFLDSAQAAGFSQTDHSEVVVGERSVRVSDFPMGIDYKKYATATKSRTVQDAVRRYREKYKKRKVIVSVDRLDPSKGLAERLKAYASLLEEYPKLQGKVVFAMIVAPSRMEVPAYKRLDKRLLALVDEINRNYGRPDWQPVDYMNVAQPFEEVTALFQVADVAFITPLKDGMNLAAKEFVASSRRRGGVLILSETAGAAEELQDALLVNPAKPETMVAALHRGLTMRRRELRRRLRRMQQQLSTNTVQEWAKGFVDTLNRPVPGTVSLTRTVKDKLRHQLVNDYRQAEKRLLMLDYDGSLVPFSEDYREANPPQSLLDLLERLSVEADNDVVLISGRSADDLQKWFGQLPLSLVAEHGASYRKADGKAWQTIEKVDTRWKRAIQPIFEKYTELTPGAHIEVKPHSLVWHYRAASPYYASKHAVTIKRLVKPMLKSYGLELLQGNKALEVKNSRIGKGVAAQRWLNHKYDFVLAIGDDATDEDLFSVIPASSAAIKTYSIKVGRGRTLADYRVPSSKEVNSLLRKLH